MFWNILGYIFIVIGVIFDLLGCIGLVRLPDVYNRLQASTKCVTLGTSLLLVGVFLVFGISALGIKAILCAGFILITSPTGAHALARGSHSGGVKLWEGSVIDVYADDNKRGK